ncbi:MAG: AAA family ATPase [Nodosilinea sp.]
MLASADLLEERVESAFSVVNKLVPALLSKAFRGELVSQQAEDEPVSVLLERIQVENKRLTSERKTKRKTRNTNKEIFKVPMETSEDFFEALSSAFSELDESELEEVDAYSIFVQAGFRPEQFMGFYEALRKAPEVRNAFEQARQETPLDLQAQSTNNSDNKVVGSGKFRLVYLWLEDFKNLKNYTVHFDGFHSIDIVLGWNGTGKSNLFKALVIILRDLYLWSQPERKTSKSFAKISSLKGFKLSYKINKQLVNVIWKPKEMTSPILELSFIGEDQDDAEAIKKASKGELPLPRFVFGYYSGPTNRLAEHFLPMRQDHYKNLLDETSDDPETLAMLLEKRRFFCAENHHAKYVLLAFFHKEDPAISQFLKNRLRIIGFESALFVIRKPRWARSANHEDFWGAEGVMRRVMERLRRFSIAPMKLKQNVIEGYRPQSEEHYYFFLPDLESLHAFAAEYQDARTFFLALESIDFSELIYDLKIQVKVQATKTEQVAITFHELSEGEQQLLMVLGLMRFTKSHQSLILLDEPDTHLNPHWSVDYLKLLSSVMSEVPGDESDEQKTSQILMSTHDPLVIASLLKEQIHLLKRDWETDACIWEQPTVNPRGLGFTGILTSEMFGMRSDLDEETLADLDNKVRLVAHEGSLTPEEADELKEIDKRLEDAGFEKAFSDPYYAAFIRAWGQRYSDLMAGARFVSPEQKEEIDRISREVLEEVLAELQAEATN